MRRTSPMRQRLAALGVAGGVLLTYPLLNLPVGDWQGIPAAYLYLFGVWAGLILLALRITEREGK